MEGKPDAQTSASEENACKQCGSSLIERGYKFALCQRCRTALAERPMPPWIKIVSAGIIIILGLALMRFPDSLTAGLNYEQGAKAEKAKKYLTSLRHFKKTVELYPNSTPALAKLFISYAVNQKMKEASNTFESIAGKKLSDKRLLQQANDMVKMLDSLYDYKKELLDIIKQKEKDAKNVTFSKLKSYVQKNPKDSLGFYHLGDACFDNEKYSEAKDNYVKALALNPYLLVAHLGVASAYRQLGEIDKAIEEINKVFQYNAESVDAYASLSRTELKRHQYKAALELAQKACDLDNENLYATATLAIVYHYNAMTRERDQLIEKLKKANFQGLDKTLAIIDGRLKLYD